MEQLRCLSGVLFVALLRIHNARHYRQRDSSLAARRPIQPQEDGESQPLVATPRAVQVSLSLQRKITCNLAAVAYIVVTIAATIATIKGYEGPVLTNSRFIIGRGSMIIVALIVLARTWFYKSSDPLAELQADAMTLVAIPNVIDMAETPVAQFLDKPMIRFATTALGLICFSSAKGSFC